MSKTERPKPNFLLTLAWSIALYMVLTMVCNQQQKQSGPPPTADQLWAEMKADNAKNLDISIAKVRGPYESALDALVKAKKMTPQEEQAKLVQANILIADTQLKDGIALNDTGRIRNAFYTLAKNQRQYLGQPVWNTVYPVADYSNSKLYGWKAWSGQRLYEKITTVLAARNKAEPVWGFIPGYQIIDALVALTGRIPGFSYAFAGFLLAFLVRAIVFPLSQKQIMYGRQMSQLTPLLREIKEKYKDDQVQANQKIMELYREYGVNPMAGCAPLLVQMPFFFSIYQCMLHYQFTFEKGTFLWINPESSIHSHGFFAANLGQMDITLTIIYGISMVVSTLLMPVTDPTQVKQQRLMGVGMSVVVTFFMFTGAVPVVSGFVLYWTFTNMLATAQSLRAYRLPLPPLVKVNAAGGGVYPQGRSGGSKWAKWLEEMQQQALEQHQKGPQPTEEKPRADKAEPNGKLDGSKANGKPKPETFLGTGETKTGRPAKHKPKRRK
jgi:YidC/Oxa1 family membrane protein insertase